MRESIRALCDARRRNASCVNNALSPLLADVINSYVDNFTTVWGNTIFKRWCLKQITVFVSYARTKSPMAASPIKRNKKIHSKSSISWHKNHSLKPLHCDVNINKTIKQTHFCIYNISQYGCKCLMIWVSVVFNAHYISVWENAYSQQIGLRSKTIISLHYTYIIL